MESPAAAPSTPVPTLKFRGSCRRSAEEHAGNALIQAAMVAAVTLLTLTGCGTRRLDDAMVTAFIDKADNAARKRFAPEICALRGKTFTAHQIFHAEGNRGEPAELTIDRKLFCSEAGKFSRLEQYVLERKSIEIKLADDLKSADVNAVYTEKLPYYEVPPTTASDYRDVQVLETIDHSRVGIEDGDIVFLSTDADITQTLVPKSDMPLPYD